MRRLDNICSHISKDEKDRTKKIILKISNKLNENPMVHGSRTDNERGKSQPVVQGPYPAKLLVPGKDPLHNEQKSLENTRLREEVPA